MAELYATLVIKGAKTINDVPKVVRERVRVILHEQGYDDLAGDSDDSKG